ncbi:MAG: hypothetical protein BWX48_01165 [Verrucomicrobia bacterium ADurb.Bin006]|jgi:hypothetical protein|nr:MAG: hypothetical protein BWX48_01165 [Verrucomicrobia bacterium ADurb.Bin006]
MLDYTYYREINQPLADLRPNFEDEMRACGLF